MFYYIWYKTTLEKCCQYVSITEKTVVTFDGIDDLGFTLAPSSENYLNGLQFVLEDCKGHFEITKIEAAGRYYGKETLRYDADKKTFFCTEAYRNITFTLNVRIKLREIEPNPIEIPENGSIYPGVLSIPSSELETLELYQFFETRFIFKHKGLNALELICYVKKVSNDKKDDIEVEIVNPLDLRIEGKKGDYIFRASSSVGIHKRLTSRFTGAEDFGPDGRLIETEPETPEQNVTPENAMSSEAPTVSAALLYTQAARAHMLFQSAAEAIVMARLEYTESAKLSKLGAGNVNIPESIEEEEEDQFDHFTFSDGSIVRAENAKEKELEDDRKTMEALLEEISDFESTINAEIPVQPTLSKKPPSIVLYKIMSNPKYADVVFVTSNAEKIPTHRIILAEYSKIFAEIIDNNDTIPITIELEAFDRDTVVAALEFLYGKHDAIKEKEAAVFKFAVKFEIRVLMNACCSCFEATVSPGNVCEFIQIAYTHEFEDLKKKCLKMLVENKSQIEASKIADLPRNILIDFIRL